MMRQGGSGEQLVMLGKHSTEESKRSMKVSYAHFEPTEADIDGVERDKVSNL